MDDRLRTIADTRGVFLWREAVELGYTDSAIRRMVRDKHWHRVRHGAYTFPDTWKTLDPPGRHLIASKAVVRQSRTPVVLSHTSAMVAMGVDTWGLDLSEVHVTRCDGLAGRREAGVRQHRGVLLPGDVTTVEGLAVTSATRVALEVSTIAGSEASICAADALLHRRLTSPDALRERYAAMSAWPNSLRTDLVLRLADGRSESVGESRFRYLCWRYSLPAPVLQHEVRDADGFVVARLDFAWPERRAYAEFDGAVKLRDPWRPDETPHQALVREKQRQDLVSEITAWRGIRFTWPDLEAGPRTAARLARVLGVDHAVA